MPRPETPLFLRSLEITGFKSFARPARFEFPPGITAFVGPNGSGKSNVVDAVRWCLGEQSMRDLRGRRSEDVIFAGPRRVFGAAEVSLTFEERGRGEEGRWAELCVARRLYRSGDAEYLLNGQKTRLRDVSQALHGLGIDGARHVVVTQGMADSLLSATAAERRGLLEQAAGLGGYREAREESRQKLATTAQNILMIETVLAEMEPRLRSLRRQARAVQEREEAVGRLRERLTQWYAARWGALESQLAELSQRAAHASDERRLAGKQLERLEEEAAAEVERERTWRRELDAAVAALHTTERERDAARFDAEQIEQRMIGLRSLHQGVEMRAADVRDAQGKAAGRAAEAADALQALKAGRRHAEELATEAQRRAEQQRLAVEAVQEELRARVEEQDLARSRHDELVERRARLGHRLGGTDAELERLEVTLRAAGTELEELAATLEQARSAREAAERAWLRRQSESAEADVVARSARDRAARIEGLVLRLRRRLAAVMERVRGLERMAAQLEAQLGSGLLAGLTVDRGWERAVAAALGDWAMVPLDGRFGALHDDHGDGFLRWRQQLGSLLDGRAAWADTFVTGYPPRKVSPLAATLLVEREEDASRLWAGLAAVPGNALGSPPLQVVTREGICWDAVGVRRSAGDARAASYLETRGEIARSRARSAGLEERLTRLEEAQRLAEANRADFEARAQSARDELDRSRREQADRAEAVQQLENRLSFTSTHLERELERRATVRQERERMQEEMAQLDSALQQAARARSQAESEQELVRSRLEAARTELVATGEDVTALRARVEVALAREHAQKGLCDTAQGDVARLDREDEHLARERARLERELVELQTAMDLTTPRLKDLEELVREQSERVQQLRKQQPPAGGLRETAQPIRERLTGAIARHERIMAQLAAADEEQRGLRHEVWRELQIETGALPSEIEYAPTDDEIRRLRARASQYAEADLSVVEECRELAEREGRLRTQVEDLRTAAANLEQIIAVADAEMKTRFAEAFAAVSEEFARVFRLMLGGGEARLDQVEGDGGVDIRVQLPGKRLGSSAAFSGGERALIASSLLFGVLKIRPTPFCILDEVDAALDETNVDRYLAALRDVSQDTQMLVVTHNRATMAAADVLYGLTMDDEGVSNVLSLRLEAYESAG